MGDCCACFLRAEQPRPNEQCEVEPKHEQSVKKGIARAKAAQAIKNEQLRRKRRQLKKTSAVLKRIAEKDESKRVKFREVAALNLEEPVQSWVKMSRGEKSAALDFSMPGCASIEEVLTMQNS